MKNRKGLATQFPTLQNTVIKNDLTTELFLWRSNTPLLADFSSNIFSTWWVPFLIQKLSTLQDLKLISLQAVLKHLQHYESKNKVQPYILYLYHIISYHSLITFHHKGMKEEDALL